MNEKGCLKGYPKDKDTGGRGGGTISALKIVRKLASLVTKDRANSPLRIKDKE